MAAVNLVIGQGFTVPDFTDTILDEDGNPLNLAGATVTLVVRALSNTSATVNATATIVDAATGKVSYTFSAAQTAVPGLYNAQWLVTESGGGTYAFPNVGFRSIEVQGSLALAPQTLVSVADAKDVLNFTTDDDVHDTKILRWINACQPLIEAITGPIIPRTIEEWHDGGHYRAVLRYRPSTALGTSPLLIVNAVSEYNGPIEWPLAMVSTLDEAVLYSCMVETQRGWITRSTAGGGVQAFPDNPEAVHIWYTVGQNTVPANVYEATLELLRQNYQQTAQMSRSSFGGGVDAEDAVVSYTGNTGFFMPGRVRELLAPNRRAPACA